MSLAMYIQRLLNVRNLPMLMAMVLLTATVVMRPIDVAQPSYQLQITFDISQSMDVTDMTLDHSDINLSRLAYAKAAAGDLLQSLPCGSRIGWSVFTGRKTLTLLTPLEICKHYAGLLSSLKEVSGAMRWTNGSSVGKAVHQGMRAANDMTDRPTVVLFTDGHEAPPLSEGQRGMPKVDKFDIDGLIVGVGGNKPVPIPKTNKKGQVIGFWQANEVVQLYNAPEGQSHEELSHRHDNRLVDLARFADFVYVPLNSISALTKAVVDSRFSQMQNAPMDLRWIPATLALLLLLWRFLPFALDFKNISNNRTTLPHQ